MGLLDGMVALVLVFEASSVALFIEALGNCIGGFPSLLGFSGIYSF